MGITSTTNLLFSAIVMLFLITFFSPDEAATIYVNATFLFIVIIEVAGNAIITGLAAIIFIIQSFAHSIISWLFNIDLDPEGVLVLQAEALIGWGSFIIGLEDFLGTIKTNFEYLLDITIVYEPYQELSDVPDIIIKDCLPNITTNLYQSLIVNTVKWLWPVINGFSDGADYFFKGLTNAKNIFEVGLFVAGFLFIDGVFGGIDYFSQGLFGGLDSIASGDLLGGLVQMGDGLLGGIQQFATGTLGAGVALLDTGIGTGVALVDAGVGTVVEVVDGIFDFVCFWC